MYKFRCNVCGANFEEAYQKETHFMATGHNSYSSVENGGEKW